MDKMINAVMRETECSENDRIQIVPKHENIATKYSYWHLRRITEARRFLFENLESVLQSAEVLDLNEVTFEIHVIRNREGRGVKSLPIANSLTKRSINQIKNSDSICLGRAILVGLTYINPEKISERRGTINSSTTCRQIREGRPIQGITTGIIYKKAEVEIRGTGNNLDDIPIFENYLQVRILVYQNNNNESIIYKGQNLFTAKNPLTLLILSKCSL